MHVDLRALAHPLRLRMTSLLTARAMSAAELARELGVAHAVASYHLRQLAEAGLVSLHEERRIRGGRERRYRYDPSVTHGSPDGADPTATSLWAAALSEELQRRSTELDPHAPALTVDAEVWVDPELWRDVRDRVHQALKELREAAASPASPGTVRTSTTVRLFGMLPPPGRAGARNEVP